MNKKIYFMFGLLGFFWVGESVSATHTDFSQQAFALAKKVPLEVPLFAAGYFGNKIFKKAVDLVIDHPVLCGLALAASYRGGSIAYNYVYPTTAGGAHNSEQIGDQVVQRLRDAGITITDDQAENAKKQVVALATRAARAAGGAFGSAATAATRMANSLGAASSTATSSSSTSSSSATATSSDRTRQQ